MAISQGQHYGTKIAAAVIGGLIGFMIGPVTGSMIGGILAGRTGGPEIAETGRLIGMAVGSISGAILGAFLVGRARVARWTLGAAFVIGGIAFLAGFAGPILLTPDSPQGPLLGIFITGPLGFIVGALIGLAIGVAKDRPFA
ncbi:MAG TPA: hypothetical protein VGH74_06285 [Planctomycetaceae bacterium]|jgi:hypothetical protein